ncbi:hypothetical protein KJ877_05325 [bacterium]|nr:hypothetical protein [bacterium]MBU1990452.1 hypothetical protein [bacterium]
MRRFYFLLWLKWVAGVALSSILLACGISLLITALIYFNQGGASLSGEVYSALLEVFQFWFPISWSISLLIALFRRLKYIFNDCISGYELKLLACANESKRQGSSQELDVIGYGDLVKVWRRWFMLMIWLVGAMMIVALALTYLFTDYSGVFEWFSIYWLIAFVLLSAYFSFILFGSRCKRVKVVKC